ncbi:MAG: 50S ribosomal protein L30e [Candidatus Anstonellales archaeon]
MAEKESKEVKRAVRKREKKEKIGDIEKKISVLVETGKILVGTRKSIKALLTGNPKLVIYASNIDEQKKDEIKKLGEKASVKTIEFNGSSIQLGKLCGKIFPVSVLVALDLGEAEF